MEYIRNNPAGRSTVMQPHNWPGNVNFEKFRKSFECLDCIQVQDYVIKLSTTQPGIAPALAALCVDQHQLYSAQSALLAAHRRQTKIYDDASGDKKTRALLLLQELVVIKMLFYYTHTIFMVRKSSFARDILDLAERPSRKEPDLTSLGNFNWIAKSLIESLNSDRSNLALRLNMVAALTYLESSEICHPNYDSNVHQLWSMVAHKADAEKNERVKNLMLHILEIHSLNQKRQFPAPSSGESFLQKVKKFITGSSFGGTALPQPKSKTD